MEDEKELKIIQIKICSDDNTQGEDGMTAGDKKGGGTSRHCDLC